MEREPSPDYQAGRRDGFLEAAKHLAGLKMADILLAAGEMTAEERRTVRAVLNWQSRVLIAKAGE